MTEAKGGRRVSLQALYSCEEMCGRCRTKPEGDFKARAASRCSLPDFDPAAWDPSADRSAAAEADWRAGEVVATLAKSGVDIGFDLDVDGCPWGWALSPYAQSVASFMGRRDPDSVVRSPSLRLLRRVLRDPEEPLDLIEAVTMAEAYEDGAFALFNELRKS